MPTPVFAADYQIIDVAPGQKVDVTFEINLTGKVYVRILAQRGSGCADFWWIVWPLGYVRQLGRHCGAAEFGYPGLRDLAFSSKLRAGGVSVPTKFIYAASSRVANSTTVTW
jgi:hypothetical protein